jgi:hypothetical protein
VTGLWIRFVAIITDITSVSIVLFFSESVSPFFKKKLGSSQSSLFPEKRKQEIEPEDRCSKPWSQPWTGIMYRGRQAFFQNTFSVGDCFSQRSFGTLNDIIREKQALMFGDSFISLPIRLSGAELELKIAANSTYWKADRVKDGLEEGEMKGRAVLRVRLKSPVLAPDICYQSEMRDIILRNKGVSFRSERRKHKKNSCRFTGLMHYDKVTISLYHGTPQVIPFLVW